MPDSIISVQHLSKCYLLGHQGERERYTAMRDVIARNVRSLAGTIRDILTGRQVFAGDEVEEFWALKDVSFEVKRGEVLGIIGRNGAGKSTLLKILSRITEPTKGRIEIKGRVASLLEVGTGFHPELTGRENIFLNGAILGMTRAEIRRQFDEIIAFAEVEKFLDTPVKRYSSGMYVRLAFAVAAHLQPEILIVDEVLAVGDAQFQKKCMGKMQDVATGGRTVLFVSHNMGAINRLCNRALLLDKGTVYKLGNVHEVSEAYLTGDIARGSKRSWMSEKAPGDNFARLLKVVASSDAEIADGSFDIRQPVRISMTYEVFSNDTVLVPNIHLFNAEGACLFVSHDWFTESRTVCKKPGIYTSTMVIPGNFLAEGVHTSTVALSTYLPFSPHFEVNEAVSFQIIDSMEGDSARGDLAAEHPGVIRPILEWHTMHG
jgi:lipopolysaccharide transport system ATP-binding protein